MNRRLFEDLVVSARGKRGGGGLAVPASVAIHAAVVGAAVLLSALGPADLMPEVTARPAPIPEWPTVVQVAPPPPLVRDPAPRPRAATRRPGGPPGARPPAQPVIAQTDALPEPDEVDMDPPGCLGPDCDPYAPPGFPIGPTGPGGGDGVDPGASGPPRAGVDVAPPVRIRYVDPVYPELARRAGVQGVVIIECTIDPKGRITNARVLRGHPLLDPAALDAVRKWIYTPSILRGAPVSVVMTVTVNFTIAH